MTNQVIPAEAVEAAAKAAAKDEDASNWHDESEYYRNGWRNRMQVALEAAAPHMLAGAWDEGYEKGCDRGEWEAAPVREEPKYANPHRPTS